MALLPPWSLACCTLTRWSYMKSMSCWLVETRLRGTLMMLRLVWVASALMNVVLPVPAGGNTNGREGTTLRAWTSQETWL